MKNSCAVNENEKGEKEEFQLYAVSKSNDQIVKAVGSPDSLSRCLNLKKSFHGTYQPKCWYVVMESGLKIGEQMPRT